MKTITPAPMEPAMSRKIVKSGTMRATPVMVQITIDLIATDFSFYMNEDPVLKNWCYSTMSKAARIWMGYEIKAFMQTQTSTKVTSPLIGNKLSVKIGCVSSLYTQ